MKIVHIKNKLNLNQLEVAVKFNLPKAKHTYELKLFLILE